MILSIGYENDWYDFMKWKKYLSEITIQSNDAHAKSKYQIFWEHQTSSIKEKCQQIISEEASIIDHFFASWDLSMKKIMYNVYLCIW